MPEADPSWPWPWPRYEPTALDLRGLPYRRIAAGNDGQPAINRSYDFSVAKALRTKVGPKLVEWDTRTRAVAYCEEHGLSDSLVLLHELWGADLKRNWPGDCVSPSTRRRRRKKAGSANPVGKQRRADNEVLPKSLKRREQRERKRERGD
jgi:hypothetical protein